MKLNVEMNKRVKNTLNSVDFIEEAEVSPFLKEKVMHRIRNASEDIQDKTWSWFTPKLQLATLVCVVVLNIMAFNNLQETTYDETVNTFAESYGLSTSSESSILY
ncbi:hypothetical protein [Psychroserpens algicola]|uniref:hypothetical protein n=1 Tax=Psychroserpens algicola TaxID=1719034 RepID=UPI001954E6E6|nr:hypothetical protein [Psychroserpens algicola]